MKRIEDFEFGIMRHCDLDICDLGQNSYECPYCKERILTCDLWYDYEDCYSGKEITVVAECCGQEFVLGFDQEKIEWYIVINEELIKWTE